MSSPLNRIAMVDGSKARLAEILADSVGAVHFLTWVGGEPLCMREVLGWHRPDHPVLSQLSASVRALPALQPRARVLFQSLLGRGATCEPSSRAPKASPF